MTRRFALRQGDVEPETERGRPAGDLLVVICGDPSVGAPTADGYEEVARSERATLLRRGRTEPVLISDVIGGTVVGDLVGLPEPLRPAGGRWSAGSLGQAFGEALQGEWCSIVLRDEAVSLVCDHLGAVPIFVTTTLTGEVVAGTDIVDVAAVARRSLIDRVSLNEFLRDGLITWPFTYYDGIQRIEPGAVVEIESHSRRIRSSEPYWRPVQTTERFDIDEVGEHAAATLLDALRGLCDRHRRIGVLLSGGEDSRAIAALLRRVAPDETEIVGDIFLDRANREFRLARAAARLLRVPLSLRGRRADHYVSLLEREVTRLGPGVDLRHAHSVGLIPPGRADLHVDGWHSDILFKGFHLKADAAAMADYAAGRRTQPPKSYAERYIRDWLPFVERRRNKLERLADFRQEESLMVWSAFWPISDRMSYGFGRSNRAERAGLSPFALPAVVEAISMVDERTKHDRALFWRAFGRRLGVVGFVPRSGGELPRLSPRTGRLPNQVIARSFDLGETIARRRGRWIEPGPWQRAEHLRAHVSPVYDGIPKEIRSMIDSVRPRKVRGTPPESARELFRYVQIARAIEMGVAELG